MMRRNALAMGAAVLAAAPIVVSIAPITASADYALPGWAGEAVHTWCRWYYDEMPIIVDTAEYKVLSIASMDALDRTNALVIAAIYAGWKDAHPSDMAYMKVFTGYYLDPGGKKHSGAILGRTTDAFKMHNPEVAQIFVSDEVELIISPAGQFAYSGGNGYSVCYTPGGFEYNGITYSWPRLYCSYTWGSNIPTVDCSDLLGGGYFRTDTAPNKHLLSSGRSRSYSFSDFGDVAVPTSDREFYELVAPAYDTLIDDYPELEPFVPDIDEPYEPIYPSEFAEGVPKSWTVENPRLPSYSLDLQLPTANYEAIDVATPIEQNASGIRFWWAMFGTLLDHFGLKSLVVLACALGLFLLVLMRLGR